MLKYYVNTRDALTRLRTDNDGVVSFEYILVAACIIAAVSFAFGVAGSGAIGTALSGGIATIVAAFNTAIGA